jgi:hypothetical protein
MAMVFPTSPVVGQVFSSGGRSWVWNGSTWDSPTATNTLLAPYGLELIASQSFTGQNSVIFNNVFSSIYDNYKIVTSLNSGGGGADMSIQLRSAGTNSASGYHISYIQSKSGTASGLENLSAIGAHIGRMDTGGAFSIMNLTNPARALQTYGAGQGIDNSSFSRAITFIHNPTIAYDGAQINMNSGTGTITIYGMRK